MDGAGENRRPLEKRRGAPLPAAVQVTAGLPKFSATSAARKPHLVIRHHLACRLLCGSFLSTSEHRLMSTAPKIIPKPVIIGFFLLGLLSSIAFRAIILLQKYEPMW